MMRTENGSAIISTGTKVTIGATTPMLKNIQEMIGGHLVENLGSKFNSRFIEADALIAP